MNTPGEDELLLALRYLSNECEASEALPYEQRLADDESAQAALVEATRIVALLKATPCCPQFAPTPPPSRARARRPWSAVLAAVVVVGLSGLGLFEMMNRPAELSQTQVASDLAHAWTALDEGGLDSADLDDELAETEDHAEEVPDWLLTAVMVQAEEAGHGDAADSEEQL